MTIINGGDFKAKYLRWKNDNVNVKGISLNNWIDDNGIKYSLRLLNTRKPSDPKFGTFLDLTMIDAKIRMLNLDSGEFLSIPFKSGHEALVMEITLNNIKILSINNQTIRNITTVKQNGLNCMIG